MRLPAFLLLAAGLSLTSGAFAQAEKPADSGCILDNCADKKPMPAQAAQPATASPERPRPRGASRPDDFDFYVLSLSWSPGFCETSGAEKHRSQCNEGSGLGFVMHGLWPQYESGFPSDCGPAGRSPSRIALEDAKGVYPDLNLARYEWRKHGTCSGRVRPITSPTRAARERRSRFLSLSARHRTNRPGRRSISSALSSRQIRSCGRI